MASGFLSLSLSYPEILFSIACFLFVFYCKKFQTSPGPVYFPIVGMLPSVVANIHRVHDWSTEVLSKTGCTYKFYGPLFLDMDILVTCDPADINHIFNMNQSNYPKGEHFLEIFDILGDGIFNANDESWKIQRKKAHGVFSSPKFRGFVAKSSRDKVQNALIPLLSKLAGQGAAFDLQDVFLRLTFDLTSTLVFGVDPGGLSEGFPLIPFSKAMDAAMEAVFFRHTVPAFWWKLMRRLRVGREKNYSEAWRVIDEFAAENIAKKKAAGKELGGEMEDVLTAYLEIENSSDDKFLRDTAVNFMLAGRDTTGVALSWFFWLLAKNPQVKSKVLEELEEHLHGNNGSSVDFTKLVYLHAAMLESLRLYPSVPFEHKGPLHTENLPSGQTAKSNNKILFSTFAMARIEGIWGKDCNEFKPQRWISERGTIRHEPSYKFLSFNAGPRTCLGKEIAFVQMKTAAIAILHNFDFELVQGHVVEPKVSIILHMKNGLMMRVKQRTAVDGQLIW